MSKSTSTIRYCGRGTPRKVPAGRVLAHNWVRHTVDMPHGINGFRCWTWAKGTQPRHFLRCNCGWAGLPHYAERDVAKTYKCESWDALDKAISAELGREYESQGSPRVKKGDRAKGRPRV